MSISVVIPTCNRKHRVLSLLDNLGRSTCAPHEVIIVDSGEDCITLADLPDTPGYPIRCLYSEKSVCIQRNIGIRAAKGDFILLCDDDIEVSATYLETLMAHIRQHPEAAAVSGHILQKENDNWQKTYPVRSLLRLLWIWLFQQSIWGELQCSDKYPPGRWLRRYYRRKGNHLSKAGWPVLTDFSGDYFSTPTFGLGASLIRKTALLESPYDEVLDRHGIGDNYGVAAGFPPDSIHVVTAASAYHHQEQQNRLLAPQAWLRRTLALDYFRQTYPTLQHIKKHWLIWSLFGHGLYFLAMRNFPMLHAVIRSGRLIVLGQNPYVIGRHRHQRIVEPLIQRS